MIFKRLFWHINPLPTMILLPFAIPFLWIGVSEVVKAQAKAETFAVAEGVVVDNNYVSSQDLEDSSTITYSYHPVVTFRTSERQSVTFTDGVGTFPADYDKGDRVEVLYDPADPHNATIRSWTRLWMGPLWIILIGLLPVFGWLAWTFWPYFVRRRTAHR